MRKCVDKCGTRAFVEVSGTLGQCVELSSCKHFVRENVTLAGETQEEYAHCYENSCPGSHPYSVLGEPECLAACPQTYYISLSGDTCIKKCEEYQEPDVSGKCVCKNGFEENAEGTGCALKNGNSWKDYAEACAAEGRAVSLAGDKCAEKCGDGEVAKNGVCECDEGYILHQNRDHCVLGESCARTFMDDRTLICLNAGICTGNLKLKAEDEHLCVTDCERWTEDTDTKELKCVEKCPENTVNNDGLCTPCGQNEVSEAEECVCASGYLASTAAGQPCVLPGEEGCRRMIDDGESRCTALEACSEGTKLALDGHTCVRSCERWTEDADTAELRCVEECPGWWYSSEPGLCREEKWRKSTAISVPIAVVVVAAAVLLTVFMVRRKKQKKAAAKPEEAMRSTVAHA